jgi:hypothetical protein
MSLYYMFDNHTFREVHAREHATRRAEIRASQAEKAAMKLLDDAAMKEGCRGQ